MVYSQKSGRFDQLVAVHVVREHVLEEVVNVSDDHAHHVHADRIAQHDGEAEQDVRQVGCMELEDAEEVHADQGIASRPHVHQHYGERLAQEQQIHKRSEDLEQWNEKERKTPII